jgi:hypothetical protein
MVWEARHDEPAAMEIKHHVCRRVRIAEPEALRGGAWDIDDLDGQFVLFAEVLVRGDER